MSIRVLALNAGSSSLKFALYDCVDNIKEPSVHASGAVRAAGEGWSEFKATGPDGGMLAAERWRGTPQDCIARLFQWVADFSEAPLTAVGHRVVHGGVEFCNPVEVDDPTLARLQALIPLAPLHQPACIQPVHVIRGLEPEIRQIACFDTAFHRTIRAPASRYALPRTFEAEGIRRFGFHGLSYESIAGQLRSEGVDGDERIIVAHLGNGASLCAMRSFASVDTTMGFSTLDGLVMGTRPGSIDPGILLYLLKERGYSSELLEELLYRQSGLLGVSGISSDVATLLASNANEAIEALDLFAFQVARHTAALTATMGGLDRFVFTGGIGENAAPMRRMIVHRLLWLGATLDEAANTSNRTRISNSKSPIVFEWRNTDEELAIAAHVRDLILQ